MLNMLERDLRGSTTKNLAAEEDIFKEQMMLNLELMIPQSIQGTQGMTQEASWILLRICGAIWSVWISLKTLKIE